MKYQEFIDAHGITATSVGTAENPNISATQFDPKARHYKVLLHFGDRKMRVPFSMGSALKFKPTALDVLSCVAMDSQAVNGRTFEDWASDYGYDTDSRRAEKTYKTVIEQSERLKSFLGEELYTALLACEE
jgi:hypothetical protein